MSRVSFSPVAWGYTVSLDGRRVGQIVRSTGANGRASEYTSLLDSDAVSNATLGKHFEVSNYRTARNALTAAKDWMRDQLADQPETPTSELCLARYDDDGTDTWMWLTTGPDGSAHSGPLCSMADLVAMLCDDYDRIVVIGANGKRHVVKG